MKKMRRLLKPEVKTRIIAGLILFTMVGSVLFAAWSELSRFIVAAPASADSINNQMFVHATVIGPENESIVNTYLTGDFVTAKDVFEEVFAGNNIESEGLDNGQVVAINGIENQEEGEWVFYYNGEVADETILHAVVIDQTEVSLIWETEKNAQDTQE